MAEVKARPKIKVRILGYLYQAPDEFPIWKALNDELIIESPGVWSLKDTSDDKTILTVSLEVVEEEAPKEKGTEIPWLE